MQDDVSRGRLSTHVLDAARGLPAAGLRLSLYRLAGGGARDRLGDYVTNADGRTDAPLLSGAELIPGQYEILFLAGDWLRENQLAGGDHLFLDQIPIRFGISAPGQHLHVPLLLSPFAYSTYRGS
ncbi:hydroxyisourate hydrolase [Pseudogemmobacter faecipullorum]|uniref:5-hydroxyisourate hydrolase n=1 Tax=Pseudogemmobacter faecipullorum TaxID=2755041 RepID=A0ABS8CPM3_9RHOB|nr:hydroxyisourate hydrolase [Pseudogemmobacter faecipullorum]MCB5411340.1 hydroxyisourate hydrolase [Pseudogemmobacter faecipullorum]